MEHRVKWELASLAMLLAMFVLAALAWPNAPERIPIHWNLSGDPDGWGGKGVGLLALPFITTGVYALLRFLPRIDPRSANYDTFEGPYRVVCTSVVGVLFILHASSVLDILWDVRISKATSLNVALGGLFIVIGSFLPKITSNWFFGVRTPWTLSSESSWHKTHRLAGPLFVLAGLLTIGAAFLLPSRAGAVMLGSLLAVGIASVVYSYFAWRVDPARTSTGSDWLSLLTRDVPPQKANEQDERH